MPKILVIDDDEDVVNLIALNLQKEGLTVVKAYNGKVALDLIKTQRPDLIILDLMLPGISGLDVCKDIRNDRETASIPIIMLTAKSEETDKIIGLEMGADDYLTKPFSVKELIARVRVILRRLNDGKKLPLKEKFSYCGLQIDYTSYEVLISGQKIILSPTELRLLFFFSRNPGKVYSRNQILDHVWGENNFVTPRVVDAHIRRLRDKIEKDVDNYQYILTVRGFGYKFAEAK